MRVLYATRPYEAVPGSANALYEEWLRHDPVIISYSGDMTGSTSG